MQFRSTVLEPDGRRAVVNLQAETEAALATTLLNSGRILIQATPMRSQRDAGRGRPIPHKTLLAFTNAMESLIEGGVPVLTALEAIRDQEEDDRLAAVYDGVAQRIASGETIAEAFGAYPKSFSPMYVQILGAGEESGNLDGSLGYLSGFLKWTSELRGVIKQATVYPIVVMAAAYGLIIFMLGVVVPKMAGMLEKMVDNMPTSSRVLFDLSGAVEANMGKILLVTLVVVIAFVKMLKSAAGQQLLVGVLARLPIARGIIIALNRARACRTLGVLLGSGLTVINAVRLTRRIITLPWMRDELERVEQELLEGQPLSVAVTDSGILTNFGLVMLRAGEDTGRFEHAFARMAAIYDDDARTEVKRAIGFLEPAMTIFIGIVIAGVAVTVINTLYTAIQGIQQT